MSQEKVDRYKQEKVNRKQIMRKQKLMNNMRKGVLVVVALALIGWLGYSAYDIYESGKERTVSEVNYDAVSDYLNGLNAEGSAELNGVVWGVSAEFEERTPLHPKFFLKL